MNLQSVFSNIGSTKTKQVSDDILVKMIRKRLLRLHDVYVWKQKEQGAKLMDTYMQTLPFLLLLGKKLGVQPWTVKVNLTALVFNKSISESLVYINKKCNWISDEKNPQSLFESLLYEYLMIGLSFGMSPKRIEKELLTNYEINHSLNLQLKHHQIQKQYFKKSLEQMNAGM